MSARIQAGLVECPSCHDIIITTDLLSVSSHSGACERCGQWFESNSPRKRFCGRQCQLWALQAERRKT